LRDARAKVIYCNIQLHIANDRVIDGTFNVSYCDQAH